MLTLSWADQFDVRAVCRQTRGEVDDRRAAGSMAKYAVKGTEQIGGIPVRIRATSDLDDWHVTRHVRRLITTCWQVGHRVTAADAMGAPSRLPRPPLALGAA